MRNVRKAMSERFLPRFNCALFICGVSAVPSHYFAMAYFFFLGFWLVPHASHISGRHLCNYLSNLQLIVPSLNSWARSGRPRVFGTKRSKWS